MTVPEAASSKTATPKLIVADVGETIVKARGKLVVAGRQVVGHNPMLRRYAGEVLTASCILMR